ncbi:hypothetical protein [Brachybacterium sp.]|uniref:anti-sigma factor family protein n=1 Tax=Brachybacterium sp. TaxID=1891286 RepID=UPI002ED6A030
MTDSTSRREELIAAALAGELDEQERQEFDRACAADPSMLRDLDEMRETVALLERAGIRWEETVLPSKLEQRVLASTTGQPRSAAPTPLANDAPTSRPRAGWAGRRATPALLGLAAAGLIAMGALGGVLVDHRLQAPPAGPPGALGAVEEVAVGDLPPGASIDVALVAHTWGTETVLEIDGLEVGETYEVVLVREDGQEMPSGTFLGAEVTIECRLNAAVMREDVSEVRIHDAAGKVVVASEVPTI